MDRIASSTAPPTTTPTPPRHLTVLEARVKKGSLLKQDFDDVVAPTKKQSRKQKKKKKRSSSSKPAKAAAVTSKTKSSSNKDVSVSPALAQWAASNQPTVEEFDDEEEEEDEEELSAASFSTFEEDDEEEEEEESTGPVSKKQNKLAQKQSSKRMAENISKLQQLVSGESNQSNDDDNDNDKKKQKKSNQRNVAAILQTAQSLLQSPNDDNGSRNVNSYNVQVSKDARGIVARPSKTVNYRLAWAGSDEAVCHLGSGLHKTPLARLQEVFLTLGKSKIEINEVIRVLGPFPNVKNVLRGDATVTKRKQPSKKKAIKRVAGMALNIPSSNSAAARTAFVLDKDNEEGVRTGAPLQVQYTSMIDGTGKEILSGKEENVRRVDLNVLFASEEVVLCHCVKVDEEEEEEEGSVSRPFGMEKGGQDLLLVFVKEEDMEGQLRSLRVS